VTISIGKGKGGRVENPGRTGRITGFGDAGSAMQKKYFGETKKKKNVTREDDEKKKKCCVLCTHTHNTLIIIGLNEQILYIHPARNSL
jgi:hypothetical protein